MKVGKLTTSRVEPLIQPMRAEGLTPELDDGVWLGASDGDDVLGVCRLFERGRNHVLEDVWVQPGQRTHGVASALIAAAKALHRPLWLICDEDLMDFYARRGFDVVARDEFPAVLADHYAAKGEWPPRDHVHVAMRWGG